MIDYVPRLYIILRERHFNKCLFHTSQVFLEHFVQEIFAPKVKIKYNFLSSTPNVNILILICNTNSVSFIKFVGFLHFIKQIFNLTLPNG